MDVSHILNDLNDAQRQAVTADVGKLYILLAEAIGRRS